MSSQPFTLRHPVQRSTSVVFSSPHSGADYPAEFLAQSVLDSHKIRSSEDAFVDELFDAAPDFGAPLLAASVPRAYVDLNRSSEELDPGIVEDVGAKSHNPRITSGLGVIPRVVANGRAIYRGKISRAEADERLKSAWVPYHAQLKRLLSEAESLFGESILVDCHSMPHEALDATFPVGTPRPDIVLGDRFGAAAGSEIVDRIEAAFAGAGLNVARNAPFAGAYIVQAYGRPSRQRHAIQVEIDRALYMDEVKIEPSSQFEAFQRLMTSVIAEIAAIGCPREIQPLAAE